MELRTFLISCPGSVFHKYFQHKWPPLFDNFDEIPAYSFIEYGINNLPKSSVLFR